MNRLESARQSLAWSRSRTLGLLDKIAQLPQPQVILGWRPGPGRAHIAWQLLHVAVTEELFATERLVPGTEPLNPEHVARYRGGSTPDDSIAPLEEIRAELASSRARLLATLDTFDESRLSWVPPALAQRNLSLNDVLDLLPWHEAHHQGQAHLTLNLYQASRQSA